MKKFKYLQLKTLDQHIANIRICAVPFGGWIRSIRKAIGMNASQLAKKIGITQQTVSQLEINEAEGTITLRSLSKAAEAMDCKLVYAIVPNQGSLLNIVAKQAHKKATSIAKNVDHSMLLEGQSVGNLEEKISEIENNLVNNMNSKLWDE